MTLKLGEVITIFLAALVTGVFWGPWVALSRSFAALPPEIFLSIVRRMSANIAPVMTGLMPLILACLAVVSILARHQPGALFCSALSFAFYALTLIVTIAVEVPIVKRLETFTPATLPANWTRMRDRWGRFHLIRIAGAFLGLIALLAGAIL